MTINSEPGRAPYTVVTISLMNAFIAVFRRPSFWAPLFCWLFFFLCLSHVVFSEDFIKAVYYTEILSAPLFSEALLAGEIDGWYSSPPVFLFPGYLIYFFFHLLFAGKVTWIMTTYAFTLGCIGVWGWIYFARGFSNYREQMAYAILIFAGVVYLFSPPWPFPSAVSLIAPVTRGGVFALLPYCLRLFLDLAEKKFKVDGKIYWVGLLIIAITVSDPIFYAWFYVPAVFLLLPFWNFNLLKRGILFLFLCAVAVLLFRQVIDKLIYREIASIGIYIPNFVWFWLETILYIFVESLGEYVTFYVADGAVSDGGHLIDYLSSWSKQHSASFFYWLAGVMTLAVFISKKKTRWLAWSLILTTVAGGIVMLLESKFTLRYALPFIFTPVLMAPLLITMLSADKNLLSRRFQWAFVVFPLLMMGIAGLPKIQKIDKVINYYPPQQACLDDNAERYGLKKGLATYWDPLPEQMFSKSGIKLFTVNPYFQMFVWNENFHRREGDDFNFVLSNVNENGYHPYRSKPDKRLLLIKNADKIIGTPHIAEFTCGSFTGYVYPPFPYIIIAQKWREAGSPYFPSELSAP